MKNLCYLCGKSQSEDGRTLVSGFFTRTGNRFCAHCGIQMSETWLQLSRKAEASALEKLDFLCNNQSDKSPNNLFPDVYLRGSDGLLVPAHKHMLARKSDHFEHLLKNMKTTDDKDHEVVNVHEMAQSALQAFVVFFYTATVSPQELEEHIVVLLAAAINYGIYYLQHQCEKHVAEKLTHRKLHWAYAIANETGSPYLRSLCETFVLERINGKTVMWALDIASKFDSASIRRAALAAVPPSRSASGVYGVCTSAEPQTLLSTNVLNPAAEEAALVKEKFSTSPLSCSQKRRRSIPGDVDARTDEPSQEETQAQKAAKIDKAPQDESTSDKKEEEEEEEYESDFYEYSEYSSDSDWERHAKPGYEWDFDQPLDIPTSSDEESPLETIGTTSGHENSSGSGSGSISRSVSGDDVQKAKFL